MAGKRKSDASGSSRPGGAGSGSPRPLPRTARQAKREAKRLQSEQSEPTPKVKLTLRQKLRRGLFYALVSGLVLVLVGVGGFAFLYTTTDIPDPNSEFEYQTSYVYYTGADGEQGDEIGEYAIQNRDAITYDEMPQDIKDAVVAAENRSFWTDNGIDVKGIIRAAFSNASGNATQGASTITQQYVKILYLTQERSYKRKVKEAILSLKLQRKLSKREILEGYLNTIYFGRGAYGIQAAAQAYFLKPASELSLKESAVLASVINNPSRYDPDDKESKVALKERYRYVLDGMAKTGDITDDEATKAEKRLPKFPPIPTESTYGGQKGHVLTMVKNELLTLTNDETGAPFTDTEIDGGGLRITTTFTKKDMDAAAQGVADVRPEGFSDKELHVGVASVEPGTGAVRGIFAGQDFLESQINWAIAGGQAGSTVKPFSLIAALKAGYSLKDTFDGNSPFELDDGTEINNEGDNNYGAAVNLIKATEDSINTAFTDLTVSIPDGPQAILDAMNAVGIPPNKGPGKHYGFPRASQGLDPFPSITLGSATISPVNMASAYATIANGGRFAKPFIIDKVVGADGTTLYDHTVTDKQVIDEADGEDIAADVSYAMQQVVQVGTGTAALGLGREAAGKTGTATNDKDQVSSAWFAGFTPQLSTAVMYVRGKGNEQLDGWLPSYFGGTYPAQTWTAVMEQALDGEEELPLPEPAYVDGEAPDDGHSPTLPPKPSPTKPTDKPTPTQTQPEGPTPTVPTAPPTTAPPTLPTEVPTPTPTEAPTPTPTPTETPCTVLSCPTTPPASSTPTPTDAPPTTTPPARAYAWWARMLW